MKRRTWLKSLFAGIVLKAYGVKPVKKEPEVMEIGISEVMRDSTYLPDRTMPYPVYSGACLIDLDR